MSALNVCSINNSPTRGGFVLCLSTVSSRDVNKTQLNFNSQLATQTTQTTHSLHTPSINPTQSNGYAKPPHVRSHTVTDTWRGKTESHTRHAHLQPTDFTQRAGAHHTHHQATQSAHRHPNLREGGPPTLLYGDATVHQDFRMAWRHAMRPARSTFARALQAPTPGRKGERESTRSPPRQVATLTPHTAPRYVEASETIALDRSPLHKGGPRASPALHTPVPPWLSIGQGVRPLLAASMSRSSQKPSGCSASGPLCTERK
jgi:hypothetical protein